MDYTTEGLVFRAKKGARYVRLYGARRTWIKVKSQYHMKKTYDRLPAIDRNAKHSGHVGLLGCGNFAYSTIAFYLKKNYGTVMRGAMDIEPQRAASLYERYGLAYYTDDPDEVINDPAIDLVYIASNHATHAEYAIRALEKGKSVHIEKPHVVSFDQLGRLCDAMDASSARVNLGFNRPQSTFGVRAKAALAHETGPAMMNWFVAGHAIEPDHWYFKEEEGGRVLGNLCHWTDFLYQMVDAQDRYPLTIRPTRFEKSDSDIAVNYVFGDGTIGSITFSAKGHVFEGVRERFAAHRGDALLTLDDFKTLVIDSGDKKDRTNLLFRNHGHEGAVKRSYEMVRGGSRWLGCSTTYVWQTGEMFLKTKEALESRQEIVLSGEREEAKSPG